MVAQNYVLRSVYLEPEMDDFLREQAFNQAVSKNDLIRRYVVAGAKAELQAALSAPPTSSQYRSISTGVLRAARGAKILAMSGRDPDARPRMESQQAGRPIREKIVKKATKRLRGSPMKKVAAKKAAKKSAKRAAKRV